MLATGGNWQTNKGITGKSYFQPLNNIILPRKVCIHRKQIMGL